MQDTRIFKKNNRRKEMKPFWKYFLKHKHYISDKHSHYLFIYDEILAPFRSRRKPLSLLEIGVQNGGSLEIWKKYLPRGSKIYGIDIDKKCNELVFPKNITFFEGNAVDESFISNKLQGLSFDIIIDDGSHINSDIIKTFKLLFKDFLKQGGVYLVEDMHACYWQDYQGGFREKDSAITFFTDMVDALNLDYYELPPAFAKQEDFLQDMNQYVKRISFYNSICAIEKYHHLKTSLFPRCRTGNICTVTNEIKTVKDIHDIPFKEVIGIFGI